MAASLVSRRSACGVTKSTIVWPLPMPRMRVSTATALEACGMSIPVVCTCRRRAERREIQPETESG
eukprot:657322-Pleurochrysis_carterae.AAC.3